MHILQKLLISKNRNMTRKLGLSYSNWYPLTGLSSLGLLTLKRGKMVQATALASIVFTANYLCLSEGCFPFSKNDKLMHVHCGKFAVFWSVQTVEWNRNRLRVMYISYMMESSHWSLSPAQSFCWQWERSLNPFLELTAPGSDPAHFRHRDILVFTI